MKVFSRDRSKEADALTAEVPVVDVTTQVPSVSGLAAASGPTRDVRRLRLVRRTPGARVRFLNMAPREVTALIGPSGCGKSTYLRILNRMHELVPGAQLAGRVELDGVDIYGGGLRATDRRKHIGMVFQKPNPFPAMTIEENVLAGLKFSRIKLHKHYAISSWRRC